MREGSVAGFGLPIALPFETLGGDLRFGDEGQLVAVDGALEGPIVAATIVGSVGHAPRPGAQPLAMSVEYELRDPSIASMLGRGRGKGPGRMEVSGTLSQPRVR